MNSRPTEMRLRPALRFAGVVTIALTGSLLSACTAKADKAADSTTIAPLPESAAPAASAGTAVTEYGYGPIRAGMSFVAANDSLKGALKTGARANLAECEYVQWEGGPAGLLVMVLENKIARVDVTDSSTLATDLGARIGDTEEHVMSLYGPRVTVSNHKYDDGHYLKVKSANSADSLNYIVFETVKGKVTRYRAGLLPGVDFVEGCS